VQLADLPRGRLLADESVELELRGVRVELAGVDPRSWLAKRRSGFAPSDAPFRLLLCHFPRVLDRVPPGRWHLILAGHLHAGQIVLPYGRGKLLLAHPSARYPNGVYRRGRTTMHVSPGLGTTFVPFRYFARPEATELVLRCA
jgi:predicted MPP superfamily phosphohydrolase